MTKEIFILNYKNYDKVTTGVYLITIGSHSYIGSASGKKGFQYRWNRHVSDMSNDKHHSLILQRCFNKIQHVEFTILEVCNPEKCIEREQYYLDTLKPDMNIRKVANSNLGTKRPYKPRIISEEHRKNIGIGHRKTIIQYSKDMTLIKEWVSTTIAASTLNLKISAIHECLKGRNKTAGTFIWKYKEN